MSIVLEPGHQYQVAYLEPTQFQGQLEVGEEPIIESIEANYVNIDTRRWRRRVTWNGHQAKVYHCYSNSGTHTTYWGTDFGHSTANDTHRNTYYDQTTATSNDHIYTFEFRYVDGDSDHGMGLTANYAPLPEDSEMSTEFYQFLQRLGEDDAYLQEQIYRHELLRVHLDREPTQPELRVMERHIGTIRRRNEQNKKREDERKQLNKLKWGVEELPPMTPELAISIEKASREFLGNWLSEEELCFYDKEGHVKIESPNTPGVEYIVMRKKGSRVLMYVDGKPHLSLGYHSQWTKELHENDIAAMKVFDLKYNEPEVHKISCKSFIPPQVQKEMKELFGLEQIFKLKEKRKVNVIGFGEVEQASYPNQVLDITTDGQTVLGNEQGFITDDNATIEMCDSDSHAVFTVGSATPVHFENWTNGQRRQIEEDTTREQRRMEEHGHIHALHQAPFTRRSMIS